MVHVYSFGMPRAEQAALRRRGKFKRIRRRPANAKGIAIKALKISRGVARAREVKQFFTTFAENLTANLPTGQTGTGPTAEDAALAPLRDIPLGTGESERIGDRIKVKGIYLQCYLDVAAGENAFNFNGAHYQFVVFQNVTERVADTDDTASIAGRYWDINSSGNPLVPGTAAVDTWAFKAGGARRYATKTLVRKLGVAKAISVTASTVNPPNYHGAGITHKVFEGYVRLAKPMITYQASSPAVPLNEVFVLFVCNRTGLGTNFNAVRTSARVDYIDA